jgi:hypothetical protein
MGKLSALKEFYEYFKEKKDVVATSTYHNAVFVGFNYSGYPKFSSSPFDIYDILMYSSIALTQT